MKSSSGARKESATSCETVVSGAWVDLRAGEPLYVVQDGSGDDITLGFTRKSDGDARIELTHIKPGSVADVHFGEETILKSEQIGSNEETVDNRKGVAEVEVKFSDLFSQTDAQEKSKEASAGTSVSVSVESEQDIEGVASFKESVTAEAHAEVSESESSSSSTTRDEGGEESTTVPKGKRIRVTETRARANGQIPVTAYGTFTHGIAAGKHVGGKYTGGHNAYWDSWQDFCDAVRGEAPDNIALARSFKDRHPWHADLWALDELNVEVKYRVTFEGRIMRTYTVEEF